MAASAEYSWRVLNGVNVPNPGTEVSVCEHGGRYRCCYMSQERRLIFTYKRDVRLLLQSPGRTLVTNRAIVMPCPLTAYALVGAQALCRRAAMSAP